MNIERFETKSIGIVYWVISDQPSEKELDQNYESKVSICH